MIRDHDALHAYLAKWEGQTFGWSTHECCVGFAAGAVKAQTGVDPLDGIKPWKTAMQARRELARRGGMIEGVSSRLDEVPVAFAKRGDIAMVEVAHLNIRVLMIVEGETLVGLGEAGLIRLPREQMQIAWSADL